MCLAIALANQAERRLSTGDTAAAGELLGESLRMCDQLAMIYAGSFSMDSAAMLLTSTGDDATAVRIEAAADAAMRRTQASWWQPRVARRDRLLAAARKRLGDAAYTAAWDSGSQLSFHAGVETAAAAVARNTPAAADEASR